jgi:SAM-dependent methyltransferase
MSVTNLEARAAAERERLLAEYARREREIDPGRYAPGSAGEMFLRSGRVRAAGELLRQARVFPRPGDACLEIGCGTGGWLPELLAWGLRESDLHAVELDASRAAAARERFPAAQIRVGDATQMPYEAGTFHLVVASTVFTSILDDVVRGRVAEQAWRVLRPGGALLWYDFRVDNPGNRNVRGIRRREIRGLFPEAEILSRRTSLLPPLARRLAGFSWTLATLLESIPILRTHWTAVLRKRP